VEPFDVPNIGRIGVLADPHGAVFSVMTAIGPPDE
jgi:predicted enzyme related to lactoylglutathione lyase